MSYCALSGLLLNNRQLGSIPPGRKRPHRTRGRSKPGGGFVPGSRLQLLRCGICIPTIGRPVFTSDSADVAELPRNPLPCPQAASTTNAHVKSTSAGETSLAHLDSLPRGVKCLLVGPEEEVVGSVGHELSLTYRASGNRSSSAVGVQTLYKGGLG
jgi:hypothetical protein